MTARTVRGAAGAALTAALVTGVTACSNPSAPAPADTAVVGIATEPETLSPLLGYGKDGNSKVFDGLLTHDADMKLGPALAEALPEVSADGRTYTYSLRGA